MSAMVNGGVLPKTTIIKTTSEELNGKQVIRSSTSEKMRKLLRLVVTEGSGKKADVLGLFPGGKTATSNKLVNGRYNEKSRISSFLSAFPIYNPRYTILIMIDEPKGNKDTFGFATGGWVSAPATGRIITRIANLKGIIHKRDEINEINNLLYVEHSTKKDSL